MLVVRAFVVMLCMSRLGAAKEKPALDVPGTGELDRSGELQTEDGRMTEPFKIWTAFDGCSSKSQLSSELIAPYCSCVVDWFRVQTPRKNASFFEFAKDPSVGEVDLSGVKKCGSWLTKGMSGKPPFLKKKMMPSWRVAELFDSCAKSRDNREGWIYCNKLVAGVDASDKAESKKRR